MFFIQFFTLFVVILFINQGDSAKQYKLVWSPEANKDGLKAFQGVEDLSGQAHPGAKHITVKGNDYLINIHKRDRDTEVKQRQELRGMSNGKNEILMKKGETWKFTYSMYIPSSLKGTTSFTHIAQMKETPTRPEDGSPIYIMSLRRKDDQEFIEAQIFKGHQRLGSTPLKPLQNKWTDVELEYYAHDVNGSVNLTLISNGKVVFNGRKNNVKTYLFNPIRPKWGIYRSLSDTKQIIDTYLMLTKMRAYKLE